MTPIRDIPNPTPLNTFFPEHLLKPKEKQKSIQEFTDQLFKTTSLRFLPTPRRKPTPPRDSSKGKAIAVIEEPGNELGPLSQEEYNNQIREMKRLNDLKAEQEKSEHKLRNLFNPATLKDQAQKWTKHEAKEETRKITRGNNPLNLIVRPNFRLKTLGFSEWLEVHALASKKSGTLNNLLLQKKKRKRTKLIKEVFVTENVRVDGMDMNLIPPPRIMPIQGLVINKQESRIFFMNGNTDIGFQRENEFHLTLTVELIRVQKQIKVDSEIVREMFSKMNFLIEAQNDCIKAREIIEKNLDNVG
ncbi:hypothetical protein Tco_0461653 [Tanacetum coccineum]